ncbi:unnamed protein product [Brassica oleracea]
MQGESRRITDLEKSLVCFRVSVVTRCLPCILVCQGNIPLGYQTEICKIKYFLISMHKPKTLKFIKPIKQGLIKLK